MGGRQATRHSHWLTHSSVHVDRRPFLSTRHLSIAYRPRIGMLPTARDDSTRKRGQNVYISLLRLPPRASGLHRDLCPEPLSLLARQYGERHAFDHK
jgi:hypothetical protein